MTRTDLIAGAKHWWYLDGAKDGLLLAWYALLAGTALIAGGPLWLAVLLLVPPVVGSAVSIWRRGQDAAEARDFYEWVTEQWAAAPAEQLPETD